MSDPSTSGKLRALSASLRLPNLPSVWSNALTGAIFACLILDGGLDDLAKLPWALVMASCLYFAGNLLNDWKDQRWDASHRPERALPSGVFSPGLYLGIAILLLLTAMGLAAAINPPALAVCAALTAAIIIYTWCHKLTAWSVIPMALCRALLPCLGFFVCSSRWDRLEWIAVPALMLFIYLILLSLRARSESRANSLAAMSLLSAVGFLLPPAIIAIWWYYPHAWTQALLVCLASAIPYLIWLGLTLTRYRKPVSRQVSALLAGIPLVDSLFLLPYLIMGYLHLPDLPAAPVIALAMAWLPCFILGRMLQRYVPAT